MQISEKVTPGSENLGRFFDLARANPDKIFIGTSANDPNQKPLQEILRGPYCTMNLGIGFGLEGVDPTSGEVTNLCINQHDGEVLVTSDTRVISKVKWRMLKDDHDNILYAWIPAMSNQAIKLRTF